MRKKYIAGNWKLNNNQKQTSELIAKIIAQGGGFKNADVAVAPPFTSIHAAKQAIGSSGIILCAQNVHFEEKGAFTGEIAPSMLAEAACTAVIIGHSERRQYFGETDETVNKKIHASIKAGLTAIVCVGETLQEREGGKTNDVIHTQLSGAFKDVSDLSKIIIAYEPVWAIGTGKNATTQQAQDVHAFIRGLARQKYGASADGLRILYGGSMKPSNAAELLACPDVDGGLIGGASLIAEDFCAIIRLSS
ncbi:MAG: triose-phosphate isomerase [Nitrospinae bacterium]|nr:triose-phosphate isomerase [Nitrospinota bacterium]